VKNLNQKEMEKRHVKESIFWRKAKAVGGVKYEGKEGERRRRRKKEAGKYQKKESSKPTDLLSWVARKKSKPEVLKGAGSQEKETKKELP